MMDPKSKPTPQEILQYVDSVVETLNMQALVVYAQMLLTCGVQRPQIHRVFFLP